MSTRPPRRCSLLLLLAAPACARDDWTFRARDARADAPDAVRDVPPPPDADRADVAADLPTEPAADAPRDAPDAALCPAERTRCGDACALLSSDARFCGRCEVTCASVTFCAAGSCRAASTAYVPRGAGTENEFRRVALDGLGNVYVLAFLNGDIEVPGMPGPISPRGGGDWLLLSYTRTAQLQWARVIGSDVGNDRFSTFNGGIAVDARGDVFVAVPVSGAGTIRYGSATAAPAATGSVFGDALVASFDAAGRRAGRR